MPLWASIDGVVSLLKLAENRTFVFYFQSISSNYNSEANCSHLTYSLDEKIYKCKKLVLQFKF